MIDLIDIPEALQSLRPKAEWYLSNGNLEWLDSKQTEPTKSEIDAEIVRLKEEYDAQEYARTRATEYPALAEQLDLLYHDMTAGKGTKAGNWYKAVKKVKTDNPKG